MSYRNKNAGRALATGSPFANIIEVNPTTGVTSGTMKTLPWIKNSTYNDTHNEDSTEDEAGFAVKTPSSVERSFDLIFMQNDADTKQIGYLLSGKTFRLVKEEHVVPIDGKYQYKVIPFVEFTKSSTRASRGGEIPVTVNILNNSADIGVDLTEHVDTDFATTLTGTFTVNKNQGSGIAEISV